jgi:hypothetical protein
MTTPSSPNSDDDEYNMCEICDDKVATHWRHDCGCKGLCDECVVKHDKECDDYYRIYLDELTKFSIENKIKHASWSVDFNGDKRWSIDMFNEEHPYQDYTWIRTYQNRYNGSSTRIDKKKHKTWLDLYKLCDHHLMKTKDHHHFIEAFVTEGDGKTVLFHAGS